MTFLLPDRRPHRSPRKETWPCMGCGRELGEAGALDPEAFTVRHCSPWPNSIEGSTGELEPGWPPASQQDVKAHLRWVRLGWQERARHGLTPLDYFEAP